VETVPCFCEKKSQENIYKLLLSNILFEPLVVYFHKILETSGSLEILQNVIFNFELKHLLWHFIFVRYEFPEKKFASFINLHALQLSLNFQGRKIYDLDEGVCKNSDLSQLNLPLSWTGNRSKYEEVFASVPICQIHHPMVSHAASI